MTSDTALRIGIAVGADRLHAVSTENGRVMKAVTVEFASLTAFDAALRRCITQVRDGTRWQRIGVHIALEPSRAQVRRVSGLPLVVGADQRHALAHLSRHETFLGQRERLSVFVGEQEPDGSLWVMCAEAELVDIIAAAIRDSKMRLLRVAPVLDLLTAAGDTSSTELIRRDGAFAVGHAESSGGRMSRAWRTAEPAGDHAPLESARADVGALAGIVEPGDSRGYDAAVAVLASLPRARFANPTMLSVPGNAPAPARLRLRVVIAAALTGMAALASPIRARLEGDRAARAIELEQPAFRIAAARHRDLDSLQKLATTIRMFRASSAPTLTVMAALGSALTEGSFVSSLTVDSLSTQATLLAPSATEVVERLGTAIEIDSVSLTGAITRERLPAVVSSNAFGGIGPMSAVGAVRELERVAIRFVSVRVAEAVTRVEASRDSGSPGGLTRAVASKVGLP
jgi:hypothetical protein